MAFSKPGSLEMNIFDALQRYYQNGAEFGLTVSTGLEEPFSKGLLHISSPPQKNRFISLLITLIMSVPYLISTTKESI